MENSKKLVKSDYFGVKPCFYLHLVRRILKNWDIPQVSLLFTKTGEEDPEKSEYSTNPTSIFTKITNLAQQFPNIWEILHILQLMHSNLQIPKANPEKSGLAKFLFNNLYEW